jgi:hypothetical protein
MEVYYQGIHSKEGGIIVVTACCGDPVIGMEN